MIDIVPEEGLVKIAKLQDAVKIYFKSQSAAAKVLKVNQTTVNRYLTGHFLITLHVARRLEIFTKGAVLADDLFFDYDEYLYDQANLKKKEEKQKEKALSKAS